MMGLGLLLPASLVAAGDARRSFDIPPGDAVATLNQFATQSNAQLLYSPDDVSGIQTRAVQGDFSSFAALSEMLRTTPLRAQQDERTNAISITLNPPTRTPPLPENSQAPPSTSHNSAAPSQSSLSRTPDSSAMKKRSFLTFLASFLTLGLSGTAQTVEGSSTNHGSALSSASQTAGSISGRVFNPSLGEYLRNAEVSIAGTSLSTVTSTDGSYRLNNVPAGEIEIVVRYTGYPAASARLTVPAGGEVERDFEMQSTAAPGSDRVLRMDAFAVEATREGMSKALAEQRTSMTIKNVINSDTFGDMIEGNIGEVLQFVPGLDIEMDATGAVTSVINRGLGNEYSALTVDGVRSPATASQGFRRAELDNTSGHGMESIEISKTNSADMDADAPAGTINLRSRSGFQRKERTINWQTWVSANSLMGVKLGRRNGPTDGEMYRILPSVTVDYSEVFLNQRFAVAANVADVSTTGVNGQLQKFYDNTPTTANPSPSLLTQMLYTDGPFSRRQQSGGMNLQYKVTSELVLSLRGQFNYMRTESYNRQFRLQSNRANLAAGSGPTVMIANPTTNTATRLDMLGSHTLSNRNNHGFYPAINYTGKRLKADLTYGWNRDAGVRKNGRPDDKPALSSTSMLLTGVGFTAELDGPDGHGVNFRQTAGPDLYNIENWLATSTTNNMARTPLDTRTHASTLQGNVEWETPSRIPLTLKAGFKAMEGSFDRTSQNFSYTYVGPANNRLTAEIPVSPYRNSGSYAPFADSNLFTDRTIPHPDRTVLGEMLQTNPTYFVPNPANATSAANLFPNRFAEENIETGYVMGTGRLKALTLQGGVRYEGTQSRSLVYERGQERSRSGEYDDFFFSGAARYKFSDRLTAITSFSQSIKRPTLASMSGVATINETNLTGSLPNLELRAEHGNNYSTRLEYYFEPVGVLSAGVFWMDIKDVHLSRELAAEELGLGADYPGYVFTTTSNAGEVRIEGFELEYRQMLTFLPNALRGFGVFASYSTNRFSDPVIRAAVAGGQPTTGSGSLGLTFRRSRFNAAARASYRPETEDSARGVLEPSIVRVNVSADYQFSPRLTIFMSTRNLTNATAFNSRNSSTPGTSPRATYRQHGISWVLGIKGKL